MPQKFWYAIEVYNFDGSLYNKLSGYETCRDSLFQHVTEKFNDWTENINSYDALRKLVCQEGKTFKAFFTHSADGTLVIGGEHVFLDCVNVVKEAVGDAVCSMARQAVVNTAQKTSMFQPKSEIVYTYEITGDINVFNYLSWLILIDRMSFWPSNNLVYIKTVDALFDAIENPEGDYRGPLFYNNEDYYEFRDAWKNNDWCKDPIQWMPDSGPIYGGT